MWDQPTCLPAASIFSSGGMLEPNLTTEVQKGIKGLTLHSHAAYDPQQGNCLWEVTSLVKASLQEKSWLYKEHLREAKSFHSKDGEISTPFMSVLENSLLYNIKISKRLRESLETCACKGQCQK